MKLGLIVNPIAGMGGKVGLKGTDGPEILEKALSLGARPEANKKAKTALEQLLAIKDKVKFYTYAGNMGEELLNELGFKAFVIGDKKERTDYHDTEVAAKKLLDEGIELLIFAGGDGTARNIFNIVGDQIPVIGIPTGVKIHSAVYANHPRSAGELALKYIAEDLDIREAEVMDIDEEAFRKGHVSAKLYGYMKIPYEENLMQNQKAGGLAPEEEVLQGIAERIVEMMEDEPNTHFIIGSGTTIRPIMDLLNLPNTLLGIDIVKNKQLIDQDLSEQAIIDIIKGYKAKIIVSVIGGQGYIFGRGNQQLSGEVIKLVGKENIIIVATKEKLNSLGSQPLLVDTGDEEANKIFNGYMKVIINYSTESMAKVKGL